MSDYEQLTGRIIQIPSLLTETLDDTCKRIWVSDYRYPVETYTKHNFFTRFYDTYFELDDMYLFKILDFVQKPDIEDDYCYISNNSDGTLTFNTRFYNGGACLKDMLIDGTKQFLLKQFK